MTSSAALLSSTLPSGRPPATDKAIAAQLRAVRTQLETRFGQAGSTLADVLQMVERLMGSLEGLASAMDRRLVEATTAELASGADRLATLHESGAARALRLGEVLDATSGLVGHIESMRQTMGFIRVFAINIKITAAGSQEFTGYAAEMLERIDYGSVQLDDFAQEVERVANAVNAAAGAEEDLERQGATLLPRVIRDLAANAHGMKVHHERVAQAAQDVAALARVIQSKVGRTLAALQIGDITRQRIEHVEAALAFIEHPVACVGDEDAQTALRRMLAAQLADLLDEFRAETSCLAANLGEMAHETDQMLRLRDQSFGASARTGGGFVGALEANVAVADRLVRKIATADAEAAAIAQATSQAARSLLPRVSGLRAVKTEIQHMAVNTSLRSGRMGADGRPLTVIASELRSEATALDHVASRTIESIEQLANTAGGLQSNDDVGRGDFGLGGAMGQIRILGDNIERQMAPIASQGQEVSAAVSRAMSLLDFHEDLVTALESARRELQATVPIAAATTAIDNEATSALFERTAALYTMAREREIHRAHAPTPSTSAAATPAAPAPVDDLEDCLF